MVWVLVQVDKNVLTLRFNWNIHLDDALYPFIHDHVHHVPAMKLSCRSLSRLWRYWSGPFSLSATLTSWESAPECEADSSAASTQQQFAAQSDHSGESSETRPRAIRKLLREFGNSSAVKRVAEDHLLTGNNMNMICDC